MRLTRPTLLTWALPVIVALSVALRLTSAFLQGNHIETLPGIYDQHSYDALARRVLGGHGFTFATDWWPATRAGEPTAHWSYLYTLYLAIVYQLFGSHPLAARLIQVLVAGVLHPWFAWRLGCRLGGRNAGLLSALISACYAYFVYYSGALMTETFYILAVLWALDIAMRLATAGDLRRDKGLWAQLGFAMGFAILLRQVFLLFVPFLLGWLLLRRGREAPFTKWAWGQAGRVLLTGAVLSVMILPWTARNYLAFGRFALLNSSAGYALYWSNHPIHGTNFMSILPSGGPSYGDLIPSSLLSLDEIALERELFTRAIGFISDKPGRFLALTVSKTSAFFRFWASPDSSFTSNLTRSLSFGLLFPLMLSGLVVTVLRAWFDPDVPKVDLGGHAYLPALELLFLFLSVYSLIHILSWSLIRYRLPVDAVLILFAAVSVLRVLESARRFLDWAGISERFRGSAFTVSNTQV